MRTQNERLLDYLEEHGRITQREAMEELGIMRLAARIADLRAMGHVIARRTVKVSNRYGETCRIAEYRMVSDER